MADRSDRAGVRSSSGKRDAYARDVPRAGDRETLVDFSHAAGTDFINLTGNEFAQTLVGNAAGGQPPQWRWRRGRHAHWQRRRRQRRRSDTLEGGKRGPIPSLGRTGSGLSAYAGATSGVGVDLGDMSTNTGDAAGDTFISIGRIFGSDFGPAQRDYR